MSLNKEILVILVFFISIISIIGLIVGSGITVNNTNSVTVANGNQTVLQQSGLQSSGYQCNDTTVKNLQNTGNNFFNSIPILGFINQVGNFIYGNIFAAFNAVGNFIFPVNHAVSSIITPNNLGNCIFNQQAQSSGYDIVATAISPSNRLSANSLAQIVSQTILVAVAFVALGLLAGTLGAGQLAPIVASAGLGISLVYFMQSILSSSYFAGTPFFLKIFIDGITGAFFIWIIIVLLRD